MNFYSWNFLFLFFFPNQVILIKNKFYDKIEKWIALNADSNIATKNKHIYFI
jgi:hypothetical protein